MELLAVSRFGSTFKFSPNSSNSSSGFTVSEVATELAPEEQKEKEALEATQKALAAFDTVYDFQNGTREGNAPIYQGLIGHLNATEKMIFEKMPNKTIGRVNLQKELAECRKIVKSLIKSTESKAPSRIRSFMTKQAGRIGLAAAFFGQGGLAAADTVQKIDTAANLTAPADKNRNTTSLMDDVKDTTAFQLNGTKKTPMELRLNESINGPGMKLAQNTLGNEFANERTNLGYNFSPSETGVGANAYMEGSGYRLETSLMSAINGTSDTRVKASLAMLAEGAKLGTFIEVEVGSEIHRLAIAESAIIGDSTMVQVSAGLVRRIMKETRFNEYTPDTFSPEMQQHSLGVDVSREFDYAHFKRITASIQWYSVDNVNLGKIATFVSDTATDYRWADVYGGIRGGTKVVASLTATLKLSENVKLEASAGAEQVNYNAFLGNDAKTTTGGVGRLDLTYRADRNQLKISAGADSNSQTVAFEYARKLNNNLEAFVEASHTKNTGGLPDADRVFAGIRGTFGGGKNSGSGSSFAPLFNNYNEGKRTLSYGDLRANQQVATDQIQVHEAVTQLDTIVYVDKSKGAAGDGLDLNNDKTLAALHLDNGGFTVTAVAGVSDMRYMQYLSIVGGKLALVNFRGLNAQMAAEGLQKGQTKTLQISVNNASGNGASIYSVTITKGSAEFTNAVARLFNITPEQAAAFVAGTKTMDQIRAENIDSPTVNLAPTIALSQGNILMTANSSDKDGIKSLSYSLYAADGVTLIKTNTTGSFGAADGVLPGTPYIGKVTFSALNNATKQFLPYISPGTSITTAAIPAAPAVTADDTANTVSGMATGMEYNLDGAGYVLYNASTFNTINFAGNHTLLVRIAAAGERVAGAVTTLNFTTNPVIIPGAPAVTADDTANTVSGMATGMEYNLDGGGYVAYVAGTFNAINFAGSHTLLVRFAATATSPASVVTTLTFTPNGVAPAAPAVTADDTANTVSGMATGMEYNLDGAGYVAYVAGTFNAINFAGSHTLLVRVAAASPNPAGAVTTLTFTPNGVAPAAPAVTRDDTANTVSGMATGMEYNLDGGGYVAYVAGTFNVIDFSGNHTLLVRVAAASPNPAGAVTTLTFTTNPDVIPPSPPTISINSGGTLTNSTSVSLSLGGTDNVGVTGWYVSESSSTPALVSFVGSAPTSFTLSSGDGVKTIYVWTRDAAGNISPVGSSTITLDTVVNTSSTANLIAVDEGTAISQTLTFGEAVKVISGNNIGGAIIGSTGSFSTTVGVSGTAGAFGNYNGNITVQDAAGNQKVINVSILLNQVI